MFLLFICDELPCDLLVGEVNTKYPPGLRTRSTSIRNLPSVQHVNVREQKERQKFIKKLNVISYGIEQAGN